jgi:hypothetical protein
VTDLSKKAGVSLELPMATKKVVNVLSSQWLNTSFIVRCGHIVAKSAYYLPRVRPSVSGSHWTDFVKYYIDNISIDKVRKSKHNKTLLRYRSQNKDNMFRPFYYKAIIRSDMENKRGITMLYGT